MSLIHEDATFSMPPFELWLRGPLEISRFLIGQGAACEGSKLQATTANGSAAFGSYKPAGPGLWEPWSIQVLEISGGRITGWNNFLYPEMFAAFGLPPRIEG